MLAWGLTKAELLDGQLGIRPSDEAKLLSTRDAMSVLLGRLRFTALGSSLISVTPLAWSFLTAES